MKIRSGKKSRQEASGLSLKDQVVSLFENGSIGNSGRRAKLVFAAVMTGLAGVSLMLAPFAGLAALRRKLFRRGSQQDA